MLEEWRDIEGFPGYRISNMGHVWSDKRNRELTQYNSVGYRVVHIRRSGKTFNKRVHRLVAATFIKGDQSLHVNHIDGDKTKNSADNLAWVTRSENSLHSVWVLDNNHSTKREHRLTDNEKQQIISMRAKGCIVEKILAQFNISSAKYQSIVKPKKKNVQWRDKPLPLEDGEEIRLIDGYDYYYASNLGNIYSMKYGKRLAQHVSSVGYLTISLYRGGVSGRYIVHRLIAKTFLESVDGADFVDHINECKTDNRAINLRWVTRKQNMQAGMRKTRTTTNYQIALTKRMCHFGLCKSEIARMVGIGKTTVTRIVNDEYRYSEENYKLDSVKLDTVPYFDNTPKTQSVNSALTKQQAEEIRDIYRLCNTSMNGLSNIYHVGVGTIHRVIHKEGAYRDL